MRSHLISDIKMYMEIGHTVVLINSASVQSSFYDVFNKHFSSVLSDDQKSIQVRLINLLINRL
jgi:hypothetical protein